jgi:cell division protein FtsQ
VGTINNQFLNKVDLLKLKNIKVLGLNEDINEKIVNDLIYLKFQNLFFLKSTQIKEIIDTNTSVETYSVFKEFPSTIVIEIEETKILANLYKNGSNFFFGSNGKLIKTKNKKHDKPYLFGDFKNEDFLKFKKIIDKSKLKYSDIKKIYFFDSKRWDIELRNGLLIKLPEKKLLESLNLSTELILSDNFQDIKIIDTRVNGQVILNGQ